MRALPFRSILTAAAVLAAAVAASGHGTSGILEIAEIDRRVDQQLPLTFGKEHRAFASLARTIRRPSRPSKGVADDLTKLLAVARACKGPLAGDAVLRAALAGPEAAADAYLAAQPGDVAIAARRLERAADRAKVASALDAASAAHALGLTRRDAGDELAMLAAFRDAGASLAKAGALTQRLLAKQARRGSPGQPLPKGPAGTIDTIAGTGVSGYAGDGGSALDAAFYFPMDVAIEPSSGLLHVCDFNNHRIRRVDADGRVRTIAGSGDLGDTEGPALEAKLHHPAGVSFHPVTGDLYISGWHVHRLIRLSLATNRIEHFAGSVAGDSGDEGPVTSATFNYPSAIAFDTAGGFLVSDQNNHRIRRVDAEGTIHALAGNGTAGFSGDGGDALLAQFSNPDGEVDAPAGRVCLDPTERFAYVADTSNHRVRRVDLVTREITTIAGGDTPGTDGDGGPASAATLTTPVDVECDAAGNLFVCDRDGHVVRRIDAATGVISRVAGVGGLAGYSGDGGQGTFAKLDRPEGLAIDRVRGRLYVADTGNNVIRVVWE